MACGKTISGIAKDCIGSKGGIIEAYITTSNPGAKVTGDKITEFTNSSVDWKKFEFKKNVSSMTSTAQISENGNFIQTDLVLNFAHMDTAKRTEMDALFVSDTWIICKDANGHYWFLGFDEACAVSALVGQTGTNRTDSNNFTVTLQDTSDSLPFEVDESAVPEI